MIRPPFLTLPTAARARVATFAVVIASCLPTTRALADAPAAWPSLEDLATQLRSLAPSLAAPAPSDTDAEAYVRSLSPLVLIDVPRPGTSEATVLKTQAYPGGAGYLRVGEVSSTLPQAIRSALADLPKDSPLTGFILDLRFASGSNYQAAVEAASVLASREPQEFQLGTDALKTSRSDHSPAFPVLVLVNRQTRQAAELLASAVRNSANKALIVGTNTAGQARLYRPLSLSSNLNLLVAESPLKLPDGSPFPASGLIPDLAMSVSEADERIYATNEYQRVAQGRPLVSSGSFRLNEAELVRRRRSPRSPFEDPDGPPESRRRPFHSPSGSSAGSSLRDGGPSSEGVQDPALGVAIDLITGSAAEPSPVPAGDSR